jgi:nickel/cobalt transporter (NiCoT) family protein
MVSLSVVGVTPPRLALTENPHPRGLFWRQKLLLPIKQRHARLPYLRRLPLPAIGIIAFLILINLMAWLIAGIILHFHPSLVSTTVLSYTLGLRHALDADHISAIDLMTRRLIATGQRPVTVGTFFSLGHSTIVVITSIVVAATATAVSGKFESFGAVGCIVGTSVSAAFLILLGVMNAYILYRLVVQMRKVLDLAEGEEEQAWKVEGGGCLFRILKGMFKLIDRPWKMYPLGVLFGMGFDTSSEIALLGISAIQAAKGRSIWLILLFPFMFTAGMCLVDTTDGALMLTVYVLPMDVKSREETDIARSEEDDNNKTKVVNTNSHTNQRAKDPLTFLYYSIVLTALTVVVALVIGIIQLLTLILNIAKPSGRFWHGVRSAGEHYEVIGGAICASFVVFGLLSVLLYKPWRRWVEKYRLARRQPQAIVEEGEKHEERVVPGQSTEIMIEHADARVADVAHDPGSKSCSDDPTV